MDFVPQLATDSEVPLYRQLYAQIAGKIRSGEWPPGQRLPATRELAGQLGLNRGTVAAAYEALESEGLIAGQVGRGSFVARPAASPGVQWTALLDRAEPPLPAAVHGLAGSGISFMTSRPSSGLFPLDDFRSAAEAVLARADLADILQLGSPSGYEPLRRYLLKKARSEGVAGQADDLIVTNGCQQALDLIGRVLLRAGDAVAVEDPIYPGLKSLLAGMGVRLCGIAVGADGVDPAQAARIFERERQRLLIVTPNFQNPTGATLPLAGRRALLDAAGRAGVPVIENDPYGDLRYSGEPLAPLKQLDEHGGTVLLRSFSKISFPGLRVGWALGPKPLIDRLRHAKESADLHTDQLSQAVLLEFAESGRLEAHRARVLKAGAERLAATLEGCRRWFPEGTRWTKPEGGMNVWVRLPDLLDAGELLARARREGVTYLPGRYFAVVRAEGGALRLSFAGLEPEEIRRGLEILGGIFKGELRRSANLDTAPAMV